MTLTSYTKKTWVEGSNPELTAGNVQTMDDQISTNARLAGSIPHTFKGFVLRTHPDANVADDKLLLDGTGYLIMSDGEAVNGWDQKIADLAVSGAGGRDAGSARSANTWYTTYAIYDRDAGTKNLLLTKSHVYGLENFETQDSTRGINDAATQQKVAQSFVPATSGDIEFFDLYLQRVGSPTDRLTVTIQSDSGGSPSGTILATADIKSQAKFGTGLYWVRFVLPSALAITAATTYWIVGERSGATDLLNHVAWGTNVAGGAGGSLKLWNGVAWVADGIRDANYRLYNRTAENLQLPAGYDSSCKIGYARTDGSSNWHRMIAFDRTMKLLRAASGNSINSTTRTLVHSTLFLPPTPCIVHFRTKADGAASEFPVVAPVPDGYNGVDTPQEVGGVVRRTYSTADTEPAVDMGFILTKHMSYYIHNSSPTNGATIYVTDVEWLR